MKKICFFIPGFANGGAQKQCINLLNEISNYHSYEIHLIYFYEGVNFKFLKSDNITLHKIDYTSFYNPKNIINANKQIRKISPDIIFSWLHACDVYSFFLKLLNPKIKWIMAERDSHYPQELKYKLRNFAGKYSDIIVANSEKGRGYWENRGVRQEKIFVVDNIFMKPDDLDGYAGFENKTTITFAGRFETQKNILLTTKAFCILSDIYPDFKFALIGEGSLLDEMKQLTLGKRVEIIPYQDNILSYFKSTDFFINLSKHEGKPNTVIENVALGSIVIVSDIKEHREILGDDYKYYIDTSGELDKIVSDLTYAINKYTSFNHELDYKFANDTLNQMAPSAVTNDYIKIFSKA